jgi:hypothetical protein
MRRLQAAEGWESSECAVTPFRGVVLDPGGKSGGAQPRRHGNQTAFDAALVSGRADAEILVGIDAEYHEWTEPEDVPHPTERLPRYRDIAETSGSFKPDWERRILGKPIQQIWRDHLLLLSGFQHDPGRWVGGKYVLVHLKRKPSFKGCSSGVPEGTCSRTERADVPRVDCRGGPRRRSSHS